VVCPCYEEQQLTKTAPFPKTKIQPSLFRAALRSVLGSVLASLLVTGLSLPSSILVYSNRLFLFEIPRERYLAMSDLENTSCVLKLCYQLLYCCLTENFLVRIRIAECFTNSNKQFPCEVMFENEHAVCSWIHHVCTCTAFSKAVYAAALQQGWPWPEYQGQVWDSPLCGGGPDSDYIFVPYHVDVLGLRFKHFTLYLRSKLLTAKTISTVVFWVDNRVL
jgi:hypothetical protein